MFKHRQRPFARILACGVIAISAFATARADDLDPDINAIWNDPTFQRQFIAGYGFNAEIEPRVTPEEVTILEKIRPLMAGEKENLSKAESTLRKAMKPDCSAVLDFTLAGICFQQDKMIDALVNYREAVRKFPSFRRAHRNLGLIFVRNGEFDDAIQAFTKMIELGGGDGFSYGLLGYAYASKQDYQAAEAAYRNALLLEPANVEWRLGLTRCVFKQQRFADAATLLDVLLERDPDNADFWILQAHAYIGMKQPLKAAEALEIVDLLGKSKLDTLYTLGDIYLTENLFDLATHAYVRAINFDPQQASSRPLRSAEVLAARGSAGQARTLTNRMTEALGQNMPEADRRALLKLEARLTMAEGESTAETAAVLAEIVKIDPLDGEALLLLGQHYSRNNEPDRAIFYYERAASIEAFEVNALIRHAQVLVGMGRYADAVPLLRRAQEIKPRDDVARYLDQVERISRTR